MDIFYVDRFGSRGIISKTTPPNRAERDPYRNDRACTSPEVANDQLLPCSSYPERPLSPGQAEANREEWLSRQANT